MKQLIVTRADANIVGMTDITLPIIRRFCDKWKSDFIVLNHDPKILTDDHHPHYRIMRVYDLLQDYDRVISLDSDIIINKSCPDLFKVIPDTCVGSIFEDVGTRSENRQSKIQKIQTKYGNVGWLTGYVNTGVMVVSKMHRDIFTPINGTLYTEDGSDDLHIGYQIHKMGFQIYEMDFRFNHMTMFSEPWNNASRFDSFIIHYAGAGIFDKGIGSRREQIIKDAKTIYGNNMLGE